MKKLFLLIPVICFLSLQPANAQFEQGNILVGVTSTINLWGTYGSEILSLGFTSTKYGDSDPYKCTNINFVPRAGYFLIDNLAAGLDIAVSTWSEKSSDGDYKESETMLAAGPFVRYYYPMEKFSPFAEANAAFGSWKTKYESGSYTSDNNSNVLLFGLGVGGAIPLGDRVTFDTTLGYTRVIWKQKDGGDGDDKQTSGSVGLKMGFIVLFGPTK
jgi:hypothetical protein